MDAKTKICVLQHYKYQCEKQLLQSMLDILHYDRDAKTKITSKRTESVLQHDKHQCEKPLLQINVGHSSL
jgi:hypothetical protein